MACLKTSDLIPEEFRPTAIAQPLRSGLRNMMKVWAEDEFVLDPSRITLSIGRTGFDGDTFKRQQLMDRYGIQNVDRVTLAGAFGDPKIPAGYAPFNVQNLGGTLYVTYAMQDADKHDDVAGLLHVHLGRHGPGDVTKPFVRPGGAQGVEFGGTGDDCASPSLLNNDGLPTLYRQGKPQAMGDKALAAEGGGMGIE